MKDYKFRIQVSLDEENKAKVKQLADEGYSFEEILKMIDVSFTFSS